MTVADTVRQLFRATFALDAAASVDALVYNGIAEWDSVGHMRLVAALESQFDLMLDTPDVLDLSSFAKALEILARHGIAD